MNHKRIVFFGTFVIALCIAIFGSIYLFKNASKAPALQVLVNSAPSVPIIATSTSVFGDSVSSFFEGTNTLSFTFSYDPSLIVISATTSSKVGGKTILVQNLSSGDLAKVYFSYEGGRGFTPTDYWTNELQSSCKDCQVTYPLFSAAGIQKPVFYGPENVATTSSVYAVGEANSPSWLAIFTYLYGDSVISDVLSTLQTQATLETNATPSSQTGKRVMPQPY